MSIPGKHFRVCIMCPGPVFSNLLSIAHTERPGEVRQICVLSMHTILQSMMNAKISQKRFWFFPWERTHQNKTISALAHYQVDFPLLWLKGSWLKTQKQSVHLRKLSFWANSHGMSKTFDDWVWHASQIGELCAFNDVWTDMCTIKKIHLLLDLGFV